MGAANAWNPVGWTILGIAAGAAIIVVGSLAVTAIQNDLYKQNKIS